MIAVFQDARACASFFLEHRLGPRGRSPSDLSRPIGRSGSEIDVEATVEVIARALAGVAPAWRGVVVVSVGWGIGPKRLRVGDYLERAQLPTAIPQGLTRWTLERRAEDFRREIARLGLLAPGPATVATSPTTYARTAEEREMEASAGERPLSGWKAIAGHLGAHPDTARLWARERALPVYRPGGGAVLAFPSELNAWVRGDEESMLSRAA